MGPAILPLVPLYFSISSELEWGVLLWTLSVLQTLLRVVVRGAVVLLHLTAPRHSTGLPLCALRVFLDAERGLPAPEKELVAGGTRARVAKSIVGALCKSRTPTDRFPLGSSRSRARDALRGCLERFQRGKLNLVGVLLLLLLRMRHSAGCWLFDCFNS